MSIVPKVKVTGPTASFITWRNSHPSMELKLKGDVESEVDYDELLVIIKTINLLIRIFVHKQVCGAL